MRGLHRCGLPWAVVFALLLALPAAAHRLAPSLLSIDEADDGRLTLAFKTPRQRPLGAELVPELPARCREDGPARAEGDSASVTFHWSAECGAEGLVGAAIGVRGLVESGTNALLRISLRDGRQVQALLHADAPEYVVPERASALDVVRDYFRLGALHIATGFDHLLFVFGLLLLVSGLGSLVATVSAFTVGHSITLSFASLGVVRFPSAAIEVCIAATLLALALELARRPPRSDAWLRRRPWTAAFGFGLLHGLGFAGALAELGLPDGEIPLALLSFNLGIEAGQLLFVAGVLALHALARPALERLPQSLRHAPVTAIGALAAYWCIERTVALF